MIKKYLFGAFFQNLDNNFSIQNQIENEFLTDDFEKRLNELEPIIQNRVLGKLKLYIKEKEYYSTHKLLKNEELERRAKNFYNNLLDCNLIDETGNLKAGIEETIDSAIFS